MYVCMYIPGVFVFETTKTKNPKFPAEFDLKLRGKDRTEDNGYNLTSYFDGFDFRGSLVLVFEGLSFPNTEPKYPLKA